VSRFPSRPPEPLPLRPLGAESPGLTPGTERWGKLGSAVCLLAALAGCAAPPPAPPPVVPAAAADTGVDGLYKGTSTRYEADRRDCPHPGLVQIYVQNRQFTYRWAWGVDVPGTIQADGTISGGSGDIQLQGKLDGKQMTGDLSNGACALHFTVERRFRGA